MMDAVITQPPTPQRVFKSQPPSIISPAGQTIEKPACIIKFTA